jgi:hypothetical protein
MKINIIITLLVVGLIWAVIDHAIQVSQPSASVQYEQKHHVKLHFLQAPSKYNESHNLFFLNVDSTEAKYTLSQLVHIGVFADTVSKMQVLQTQADTLRVLLPKQSGSLIDKISLMQITENLVLLSFYTNVITCSKDFDSPTGTLKKQKIELWNK